MGFGGVGSMHVVLKNNKLLLNKKDRFKKSLGSYGENTIKSRYVFPEVRPHTLRRIRRKVQKENRRIFIKRLILLSIMVLILTMILIIYS